jgi:hypothetical protein
MQIILHSVTQYLEGWQAASEVPVGRQLIPLEGFEVEYIKSNIKPWTHDNGAFRYILCEADDSPVMSLRAGYHFRLRTANELAQDSDHPIYPICWFHMDLSDPYGDDPPGIKADGSDQLAVSIALRSGPEETAPMLTQITDSWRITVRKIISENDLTVLEADVRRLPITEGEISFNYTSTKVGTYTIVAEDFPLIEAVGMTYQVKLSKPVMFKVWQ